MVIETYKIEKERLEKEEREKSGIIDKPEDTLTVKKIMDDKEMSDLWGKMADSESLENREIMARAISGKPESGDLDKISDLRAKFSEKMRDAENIKSELTPELAKELAKSNPHIEKLIKDVGSEGILSAVHKTIKEMAISDPDEFNRISFIMKNIQGFKNGELKQLNDRVEEVCKKQGINSDRYLKALSLDDEKKRNKAIMDLVAENGGFWKQLTSGKRINQLINMKGDIDTAYKQLDLRKIQLGLVLNVSLKGNKSLQEALSREMFGEPKKKETVGMNDVKKYVPTAENSNEEFKKWRRNININDAMWNQLGDVQKDPHRDEFLREKSDAAKIAIAGKGGFWSAIFGELFDTMFAGFDKKSLN